MPVVWNVCIRKEIIMEIIEVTDLKRPELVVYAELSERQLATIYEPKMVDMSRCLFWQKKCSLQRQRRF